MNATDNPQLARSALSASSVARLYTWVKRSRARRRARSLAHVDARTLRDIGFSRRDIAVLKVVSSGR
jgi:uncharacterized protein YjiS (DUF1127 family)